jgi:hypothetical protein
MAATSRKLYRPFIGLHDDESTLGMEYPQALRRAVNGSASK